VTLVAAPSRAPALSIRILPVSNHANVEDPLSIIDSVDNPIVSYSNTPQVRRTA
jgi:hypothetical protein